MKLGQYLLTNQLSSSGLPPNNWLINRFSVQNKSYATHKFHQLIIWNFDININKIQKIIDEVTKIRRFLPEDWMITACGGGAASVGITSCGGPGGASGGQAASGWSEGGV